MSAYRQAMLSVAPERVEQFSLELKQSIKTKKSKRRTSDGKHRHSSKDNKKKSSKKEKSSDKKSNSSSSSNKRKRNKDHVSHKKRRSSKSNNERLTDDSDVEENGMDLKTELFPLSHYAKDRRKLLDIMFRIVKGPKLTAMLPDTIKTISEEELKRKCFSHLEVMSTKRITHIISGEAMHSSSGTDSEAEHEKLKIERNNEALAKYSDLKSKVVQDEASSLQTNFVDSTTSSGCEVLSLLAAGSQHDSGSAEVTTSHRSIEKDADSPVSEDGEVVSDDNEEVLKVETENVRVSSEKDESDHHSVASDVELETVEIVEDVEYEDMVDAMLEETLPNVDGQKESDPSPVKTQDGEDKKTDDTATSGLSQLELLELRLRARAIKSLLKAAQETNTSET